MAGDGPPLAALPNIGLASLAGGRVIYPHATPEYFAEFAAQREKPRRGDDRRLLRHDAVGDRRDPRRARRRTGAVGAAGGGGARARRRSLGADREETRLARDFREGRFVVSVQIDPPLGGDYSGLLETVEALRESGAVGYVDINDNATARAGSAR